MPNPLRVVSSPVSVAGPRDGLTDMQRRFAEEFVLNGGKGEEAAIAAGYGRGADNMSTRNLCKPRIVAEIKRLSIVNIGALLPEAIARLKRVMEESKDDKAVVAAAFGVLDRGGMSVPRGGNTVAVQVNVNGQQAQAIIREVHEQRSARLTHSDGA